MALPDGRTLARRADNTLVSREPLALPVASPTATLRAADDHDRSDALTAVAERSLTCGIEVARNRVEDIGMEIARAVDVLMRSSHVCPHRAAAQRPFGRLQRARSRPAGSRTVVRPKTSSRTTSDVIL